MYDVDRTLERSDVHQIVRMTGRLEGDGDGCGSAHAGISIMAMRPSFFRTTSQTRKRCRVTFVGPLGIYRGNLQVTNNLDWLRYTTDRFVPQRWIRASRWALYALLISMVGCSGDLREDPEHVSLSPECGQEQVEEPITFMARSDDAKYGLPREGASSIADLIALLPQEDVGFGDARTFTSSAGRLLCPSGGQEVVSQLPMDIEGVVTLHPRRYMKIPVCDQDEKHYGVFTIEDDTAGIVVLREALAHFDVDRVRMRVHALTLTYLGPETRAVLSASTELLDASTSGSEASGRPLPRPSAPLDWLISAVSVDHRIYIKSPTNKNLQLDLANRYIPEPSGC